MILSKVREVAEANGVTSSYQLQNALGVKPTVAVRLWRNQVTRFSTDILNRLCSTFHCQVADLLVYVPDTKKTSAKEKK
jgi:DNA-binding Xre family transcriptional regulator